MTPDKLREKAAKIELAYQTSPLSVPRADPNQLRAHAAALEELDFWKSAHTVDVRKAELRAERAEAALADAERRAERLKGHAEAMCLELRGLCDYPNAEAEAYRAEFKGE